MVVFVFLKGGKIIELETSILLFVLAEYIYGKYKKNLMDFLTIKRKFMNEYAKNYTIAYYSTLQASSFTNHITKLLDCKQIYIHTST